MYLFEKETQKNDKRLLNMLTHEKGCNSKRQIGYQLRK